MLEPDVRIVRQTEDARFTDGNNIPFIRVVFNVGPHGPFTEKIDKAEFSAQVRDDRLNTFARQVRVGP